MILSPGCKGDVALADATNALTPELESDESTVNVLPRESATVETVTPPPPLMIAQTSTESPALTPDEGTTRAIEFPLLAIVLVPRSRTKAGGAGPAELSTVTWTGTDVVRFPAASHATAARVWLPVVPLAFQDVEYGGDVDTPPSGDPSS